VQIVIAPVRAGRYLLGVVIIAFVGFVLAYGLAMALGSLIGMNLQSWWPLVFFGPAILVVAMVMVRMLTAPLLLHFGGDGSHSHGSARIATKAEIAPLRLASTGLLIGRHGHGQELMVNAKSTFRYIFGSHCIRSTRLAVCRWLRGVSNLKASSRPTWRSA
jgi:hypothetical protein